VTDTNLSDAAARVTQRQMGSKIAAKFRTFHPCKFMGGMSEMSESVFRARRNTQPLIYF